MKKKLHILLPALFMALVIMIGLCVKPGLADFGDFSGDSDFGGSDFGSSDSSWDSGSDYYDSDSSGGGGMSLGGFVIFGTIVVIIIVSNRKKTSKGSVAPGASRTAASDLKPMESYAAEDASFRTAALQEKLANLYVQMQNGWTAKDIEPLRPYFTDTLFSRMERQLDAYRTGHRTNYVEKIAVLGVNLRGWYRQDGVDHIIAELSTRIVDYTLDDQSGELVSGDRKAEKFMVYEWDLTRAAGQVSGTSDGVTKMTCPNCGAPLEINTSARCPYCDAVLEQDARDWAISGIKGISQRTNG